MAQLNSDKSSLRLEFQDFGVCGMKKFTLLTSSLD
jgi:hypothetical protein